MAAPSAEGGIVVSGLIVTQTGSGWIDACMPAIVTGAVASLTGLTLAAVAFGRIAGKR